MPVAFLPSSLIEVLGNHGDAGLFASTGRWPRSALSTASWASGAERTSQLLVIAAQVVGARVEHDVHQLVFRGLFAGNENLALAFEHPGDAALLAHVSAVLGEDMADLADGAVAVVGSHIDQDGGAARPVAFEHHFLDLPAFQFARAAHDGLLDVVGRHADVFGGENRGAQARIAVGIAAVARGDRDFLDESREDFTALGVESRLLVLNCRPFGMA